MMRPAEAARPRRTIYLGDDFDAALSAGSCLAVTVAPGSQVIHADRMVQMRNHGNSNRLEVDVPPQGLRVVEVLAPGNAGPPLVELDAEAGQRLASGFQYCGMDIADRHDAPDGRQRIVRAMLVIDQQALAGSDLATLLAVCTSAIPIPRDAGGDADGAPAAATPLPLDLLSARLEAIEPAQRGLAVDACLTAMVATLEPGARYFNSAAWAERVGRIDPARQAGLGLEFQVSGQDCRIANVFPESPAAEAGLKRGDLLLSVDGQSCGGAGSADGSRRMRGPPGSTATLVVRRPPALSPMTVKATRGRAVPVHVADYELPEHTLYIDVRGLASTVPNGIVEQLKRLHRAGSSPFQRVILDLRHSGGGPIDAVAQIASLFIAPGQTLLDLHPGRNGQPIRFTSHRLIPELTAGSTDPARLAQPASDLPMVVLIGPGTVSGSEALAAALRQWHRARLVGTRTRGVGTAQMTTALSPGREPAGIQFNSARIQLADGVWLDQHGVEPDVTLDLPEDPDAGLTTVSVPDDDAEQIAHDPAVIKALTLLHPPQP